MDINKDGRVSLLEFVNARCFQAGETAWRGSDRKAKEAMKVDLLHAMRPQSGHENH
jgi:hypothetical protein